MSTKLMDSGDTDPTSQYQHFETYRKNFTLAVYGKCNTQKLFLKEINYHSIQ